MAIWDEIGKKASETTAKAVQQAKVLAETTKLNSMISDEEKKINNEYMQIGKLYATLHREDPEKELAGMVEAVIASEQKIKEYRTQIQELKGIMCCEKCGAEVAKGAAFCSTCGAPMPKEEATPDVDKYEFCTNCGAKLEKGTRFCTSCGNPMFSTVQENPVKVDVAPVEPVAPAEPVETVEPVQPVEVVEPVAPVEVVAPAEPVCPNCGTKIEPGMSFCTECGTKVL